MREIYVPADQIDALGWATIAWHELELVLSILAKALVIDERSSAELITWPQSIALLKREVSGNRLPVPWRRPLNLLCQDAITLADDYAHAATAILYARGGGALEALIVELAKTTGEAVKGRSFTSAKIRTLEAKLRDLCRQAAILAQDVLAHETRHLR